MNLGARDAQGHGVVPYKGSDEFLKYFVHREQQAEGSRIPQLGSWRAPLEDDPRELENRFESLTISVQRNRIELVSAQFDIGNVAEVDEC
jgi:hypothetical protein